MDNFHFNIKHPFLLFSLLCIFPWLFFIICSCCYSFMAVFGFGFSIEGVWSLWCEAIWVFGSGLSIFPQGYSFFVYVVCFLCLMFNFPGLSSPQLHKLLFKSFLWAFSYPCTFKKTSLNKWINILPAANDLSTNYKGSCLS